VVGFKPSFGRVPVDPPFPGRAVGPLTRTVADAALLTGVLSAPDPRDHLSLPPADIRWAELDVDLAGLRLGLHLDAGVGLPVEPDIRAAVAGAARCFEAAGATVEPVAPFLTREMLDGVDMFWQVRAWADIEALPDERRAKVLPYLEEWASGGATVSGRATYHGFSQMDAMSVAALRAGRPFDFVLSPTCPVSAPPADRPSPTNDPRRPFEHIGFTVPYNMSGQPAVSVN
jgi:aspartyl-tRNA(Asn)/glutamyl-tRNA(Gln) amidotransferase subunit A